MLGWDGRVLCVSVCVCARTCEGRELMLGVILSLSSTLFIAAGPLSQSQNSSTRLVLLGTLFQGSPVLIFCDWNAEGTFCGVLTPWSTLCASTLTTAPLPRTTPGFQGSNLSQEVHCRLTIRQVISSLQEAAIHGSPDG